MSIFLINPFVYSAAPPPSLARTFFQSTYNGTRATTTSTAYVTRATESPTLPQSQELAVFWQAVIDSSVVNSDTRARLFETSARQTFNIESQDATDRHSVGGMRGFLTGFTPSTYEIQYSAEGGTAGINATSLVGIIMASNDRLSYDATSTTGTASPGTEIVPINPIAGGEYIIVASAEVDAAGNAALYDGTTLYGQLGVAMNQDATTWSPYWHVQRLTGLTGLETISVRAIGTGSVLRNTSIVAFESAGFENVYYTDAAATTTTTSTTYTSALSNTFNIVNPGNYHLILASAMINNNTTATSTQARLFNTTESVSYNVEQIREPNATTEWYPTIVARIVTFTGASNTIQWQYRTETGGTATSGMKNKSIAIFDLGVAP